MSDMRRQSCRHFNGIQHETCEQGIRYQDIRQDDKPFPERFPCVHLGGAAICPLWQPYTEEELAAEDAAVAAIIRKLNGFASGETHACPTCGAEVTSARIYEKSEPETFSLYVLPCNHRQGLWSKVPAWITEIEVVPVWDGES